MIRAWAVALASALAATAAAAQQRLPRWRIDPHTRNEPKLLERAGYLSFGPFPFGERGTGDATTEDIDKHLAYDEILWVETAHFRIGSSLREWTVPMTPEIRAKIRGELTDLAEVLPRINPKVRTLSPWLRLHLIAYRCEKLYREFQELIGVSDADFPDKMEDVIVGRGRFMGYGKYLGMRQKYLLLLTDKHATAQDYLKAFTGRDTKFGQRWHFVRTGALIYSVGSDGEGARLRDDTAMHAHVVHNLAHNFVDGYRGYAYDTPVWITEGLAHWFERRVSEKWNSFCKDEGAAHNPPSKWNWKPDVRAKTATDKFTPFAEVMTWRKYSQIEFPENEFIWSRWDYLMSLGPQKFADFMLQVKGRVDPKTWLVDQTDLVGACREGLRTAYNLSPLTLDEKWKDWVRENYPSQ